MVPVVALSAREPYCDRLCIAKMWLTLKKLQTGS